MAGSKKGERRGNARKRMSDADPSVPKRAHVLPTKYSEDYMRQIVLAVNGARGGQNYLPPREEIKACQDYVHDQINELKQSMVVLTQAIGKSDYNDRAYCEQLERNYLMLRREINDAIMLVSELSFKTLPYFHAKISPSAGSEALGSSPLDILKMLLREVDELSRGQTTWMPGQLKLVSSK